MFFCRLEGALCREISFALSIINPELEFQALLSPPQALAAKRSLI